MIGRWGVEKRRGHDVEKVQEVGGWEGRKGR